MTRIISKKFSSFLPKITELATNSINFMQNYLELPTLKFVHAYVRQYYCVYILVKSLNKIQISFF